jgi:hypothetical protein
MNLDYLLKLLQKNVSPNKSIILGGLPVSENNYSPYLPQLHPIALTDWLPKLGEKAFLSWLHFHSWKPLHYSAETGILLPFSLNKVIRKLGVGKATFYEKIIQPLQAFGLIKVIASEFSKQENHLLVYYYPHNCKENAEKPLNINLEETMGSVSSSEPVSTEYTTQVNLKPVSFQSQCSSTSEPQTVPVSNQFIPPSTPVQDLIQENDLIYSYDLDLKEKEIINHSSDDLPIPEELTATLYQNPLFYERSEQILKVYHLCKSHPSYTLDSFLVKLNHCIYYPHDPRYFAPYLHKSLLNEWEKNPPTRKMSPTVQMPPRLNDVPEWILRQAESAKLKVKEEVDESPPELMAEINQLLRDLGEIV